MIAISRLVRFVTVSGWVMVAGGAACTLGVIRPADAAPGDFQPYPLQHAQATEIEAALIDILPAGSEVVADRHANRILVRGSSQAHIIVQNAIRSLDRPGPTTLSPEPPPPAAKPVLVAYHCPAGKAEATAAWLRQNLRESDDLRIVADPRTSQILVLATPEIHSRIAAELGRGQPSTNQARPTRPGTTPPHTGQPPSAGRAARSDSTPAGSSGAGRHERPEAQPPRSADPSAVQPAPLRTIRSPGAAAAWAPNAGSPRAAVSGAGPSQVVQLRHMTAKELEATLTGTLGSRIARLGGAGSQTSDYRLAVSGGRQLELSVDRAANRVRIEGTDSAVEACVRLIHALDIPRQAPGMSTQVLPLKAARSAELDRAVAAIQTGNTSRPRVPGAGQRDSTVSMLLQRGGQERPEPERPEEKPLPPGEMPGPEPPPAEGPPADEGEEKGSLIGPVQIELLEGLDIMVIRGLRRDVEQVIAVIEQIERLAGVTEPAVEVYDLKHVDCEALAVLVNQLYGQIFLPRQGAVSVTALVKPNALLLIGQRASVKTALDLVKRLDRPVAPQTQFRVFRLRHASAETVQAQVLEFYAGRAGLGTKVMVTSDFRSNSLIVMARQRDMLELETLIERLDTSTSEAINEIRVFKLENSLADDLAPILQDAIGGEAVAGRPAGQAAAPAAAAAAAARRAQGTEAKSAMLSLLTIDARGQRRLESGILTDARVTADRRANALVVSAPAQSMPLLEELIRQLDQLPAAEAQIKVFTIVNGDATSLIQMLEALFAQQAGTDQLPIQTAAAKGESSLVPLRFGVDVRSNSIIASGTAGDLIVVEAILLRLDESDVRNRKSLVYRLRNAPALDVANAINEFLRSERQVQQIEPGLISAFEQIEREVVVVPEAVSNSLIISATPRFYDEIVKLIEDIDERPPMVVIQVLIAEVTLNDTDEFGVELGLQDSILFDRSILDNIQTLTTSQVIPAGGSVETQSIASADITPGFAFNNQALGNSGAALQNSSMVGTQALSSFGVNRINSELGFGGLVLSASSESVSILIRALKDCRRLDVLSRPQVMTLDNQPAFIMVGQRVPTITGTQLNETGQINNVDYANVGLILGVTPRISPDGLVVMEIDANKSEVGPEEEGIPISISATGEIIRSPRINTTQAQTTVSALDGQTIVLGGLITKSKSKIHRRVPLLASIPVVGNLFRYDNLTSRRTELLIIMSPHIVENEEDANKIKQVESSRMSWILGDVLEIHGDVGVRARGDHWEDAETTVVYPDLNLGSEPVPAADAMPQPQPEMAPAPDGSPFIPEAPPGQPGAGGPQSEPKPMPRGAASALPFLPRAGKSEKPPFRPLERLRRQFAGKKAENRQAGYRVAAESGAPEAVPARHRAETARAMFTQPVPPYQVQPAATLPNRDWPPPSEFAPAESNPLRDSELP